MSYHCAQQDDLDFYLGNFKKVMDSCETRVINLVELTQKRLTLNPSAQHHLESLGEQQQCLIHLQYLLELAR